MADHYTISTCTFVCDFFIIISIHTCCSILNTPRFFFARVTPPQQELELHVYSHRSLAKGRPLVTTHATTCTILPESGGKDFMWESNYSVVRFLCTCVITLLLWRLVQFLRCSYFLQTAHNLTLLTLQCILQWFVSFGSHIQSFILAVIHAVKY